MPSPSYAQRAGTILREAGLAPKKSWGQNFLRDDAVLGHIADAAGAAPGEVVLELGAGLGALTLALLERGVHVVAVERDRELVPLLGALQQQAAPGSGTLTVLEADAARLDYAQLANTYGPLRVAGNLPYQLSGRILVSLADAARDVVGAVVLVQREVGERLAARPGEDAYGLLSVLVQRRFEVTLRRHVPPGAFLPPPKVHSAVLTLRRVDAPSWLALAGELPPEALEAALVRGARAAFSSRRKTLRNALQNGLRLDRAATAALLEASGIDGGLRAEVLDMAAFGRLGAALARLDASGPRHPNDAEP